MNPDQPEVRESERKPETSAVRNGTNAMKKTIAPVSIDDFCLLATPSSLHRRYVFVDDKESPLL